MVVSRRLAGQTFAILTKLTPAKKHHLVSLSSAQNITKLLQRTADELRLLPQVGCEVSVCVSDSDEGGLEGVLEGLGGSGGGSVDVVDTGKLEKTLDGWGCDKTGTTGSWDKSDGNGTTLSTLIGWQRVRKTKVGTPVSTTDWQNAQLGDDDGGTTPKIRYKISTHYCVAVPNKCSHQQPMRVHIDWVL